MRKGVKKGPIHLMKGLHSKTPYILVERFLNYEIKTKQCIPLFCLDNQFKKKVPYI
jgi:hypothetical protein